MKTRKRVITLESRSQTIIYRGGVRYDVQCDVCGSKSVTILPEGTDAEDLRRFESKLEMEAVCRDLTCPALLEGETLPQF